MALDKSTFKAICRDIAAGTLLKDSLNQRGISHGKFYNFLSSQPDAEALYRRARSALGHHYLDEIVQIADGQLPAEPGQVSDSKRDDLRVRARMWAAAKNAPHTLGDRIQVEHSGGINLVDIIAQRDAKLIGAGSTREAPQAIEYTERETDTLSDFGDADEDEALLIKGLPPSPFL